MNNNSINRNTLWSAVFFLSIVIFHVGHLVTLGVYESFFDYISYSSAASGLLYIFSWGGLIYNLFRDPVNKQKINSQRTVKEDDIDG